LRLLSGSFYFQKLSSVCGYVTNVCAIFLAIHGFNLLATPPTPAPPPDYTVGGLEIETCITVSEPPHHEDMWRQGFGEWSVQVFNIFNTN
jgi:hypothetical protein